MPWIGFNKVAALALSVKVIICKALSTKQVMTARKK
jgi:hypothetical protein